MPCNDPPVLDDLELLAQGDNSYGSTVHYRCTNGTRSNSEDSEASLTCAYRKYYPYSPEWHMKSKIYMYVYMYNINNIVIEYKIKVKQ